jgi:type II secretory pathway component PulF
MSSDVHELTYTAINEQSRTNRPIGYDYHGWTITNREVVGFISCTEAADERSVRQRLERALIRVDSIAPRYGNKWNRTSKVTRSTLIDFAGKLAEWLDSGQTMPMALRGIANSTNNITLAEVLEDIADSLIDEGMNPAPAFREYNDIFPDLFITAIQVGHEKGDYKTFLKYYEETQREYDETVNTFKSAMIYPCIVLAIGTALAIGLVYYVLPQIEHVLLSMMNAKGEELPLPTQIVLNGSRFLASWPGMLLIAAIFISIFVLYTWAKGSGRETVQRSVIYWPFIGTLLRDHHAAYAARMIGMLIDIDVLTALTETTKASTNVVYKEMLEDVYATVVAEGLELSDAMAPYGHLMGSEFQAALVTGQQASGGIDKHLIMYADILNARTRRTVRNFSKFVEPALTVMLAAAVVLIIAAVYLPITDITSRMSGS